MAYEQSIPVTQEIEVIAEVGLNHNGSLDLAKKHVEMAAKAGATTVKFQTYRAHERVPEGHPLHELLVACELGENDFRALISTCGDWGVKFLSTAFGLGSLNTLSGLGVDRVKIASFSIADAALIQSAIARGISLVVSTGASTKSEILLCNDWLPPEEKSHVFLHCMSAYPIQDEKALNLTNIPYLRQITGRRVGFSDHSIGPEAMFFASLLGSEVLEKHFTVDNSLPGPDQAMSANPAVLEASIRGAHRAKSILGEQRESVFAEEIPILGFRTESGPNR